MRERVRSQPPQSAWHKVGAFLDNVIMTIAPVRGARRIAMRKAVQSAQMSAAYDAAQYDETRSNSWLASRLSPDSDLESDLQTTRDRSRDVYRNDSVGGAVDTRCNLVVSYGFTPQARIKPRAGKVSESQATLWSEQLEEVYDQLYPRIDLSGKRSLWQLLRLTERHHGFDGESFTIMSDVGAADKPIPLTLEVIDPERVETPPEKSGDPKVRLGIEYNAKKQIVAYWVRKTHPGDTKELDLRYDRISAERVLHVFEQWFSGQSRGLPWLTRTLNRVKDAKDLDEATIIAAQVEACYAAFVTSPAGAARAALGNTDETVNGRRHEDIRPGTIRYLDQGEAVAFGAPSRPGSTFAPFMEWNYRRMAGGMNFPYEMLAKNWGGLSFAAGRLSLADAKLFVKSQQKLLIEMWLAKVWERMVAEAIMVGAVDIPAKLYMQMPWAFHAHTWTAPAWPYALTPGEEVDAMITKIDNNLATKADGVAEFGGDWEAVAKQRKIERALEREYEIEPASAQELPPPPADPTPQKKEALAA